MRWKRANRPERGLGAYEEGVKLLRQSYELLQRAERRIELLSGVDAEGNPVTQPFDDTATFDQDEPGKRRSRRRFCTENSHLKAGVRAAVRGHRHGRAVSIIVN